MITGLDHIAIAVRDFEATVDAYRRLFGREPDLEPGDGAHRAWFCFPNMAFEIIAPGNDHPGHQVRKRLDEAGEGQWLAAFQVDDVAGSTRLLERRGLPASTIVQSLQTNATVINGAWCDCFERNDIHVGVVRAVTNTGSTAVSTAPKPRPAAIASSWWPM